MKVPHHKAHTCSLLFDKHVGKRSVISRLSVCSPGMTWTYDSPETCLPVQEHERLLETQLTTLSKPSGIAAVPQRGPTNNKAFSGVCKSESCGSYHGWQQELPGNTRSLSVVPASVLSMKLLNPLMLPLIISRAEIQPKRLCCSSWQRLGSLKGSDEAQQLSGLGLNESIECFVRRTY